MDDSLECSNTTSLICSLRNSSRNTLLNFRNEILILSSRRVRFTTFLTTSSFSSLETGEVRPPFPSAGTQNSKTHDPFVRSGNGNGDSPSSSASISSRTSVFKNIGLISTASATNINGMYDNFGDAVSPGGVLRPEITAVAFNAFTNIADASQLAKFGTSSSLSFPFVQQIGIDIDDYASGLQNGPTPDESRNIVGKWEALSLVPANDPSNPSDYFLFSAADNDFIATDVTRDGESIGGDPYGVDVPNQFFVHLVTLGKATEEGGKMKKAKKDKKH